MDLEQVLEIQMNSGDENGDAVDVNLHPGDQTVTARSGIEQPQPITLLTR